MLILFVPGTKLRQGGRRKINYAAEREKFCRDFLGMDRGWNSLGYSALRRGKIVARPPAKLPKKIGSHTIFFFPANCYPTVDLSYKLIQDLRTHFTIFYRMASRSSVMKSLMTQNHRCWTMWRPKLIRVTTWWVEAGAFVGSAAYLFINVNSGIYIFRRQNNAFILLFYAWSESRFSNSSNQIKRNP